jgi:hypothetical protein
MKTNGVPEKLYLLSNGLISYCRNTDEDVEYTNTDAVVNKAVNFLNYKLDDVVATRVPGTLIPHHVVKQELIDDLEKYIKGE